MDKWISRALRAQGLYYMTTGLWPLISIGTFMAVTGPKADRWLVKTVGMLAAVIGATLFGAARRRTTPEILLLAAGSAVGFAAVDLRYGLAGRISRVYLTDVPPQLVFAGTAAAAAMKAKGATG